MSLLAGICLLSACGGQGGSDTPAGYSVTVKDFFGKPCTDGVIVRFLQGGKQVTMQVVDANGNVTKDLADGEYTVELKFTGDEPYYYDTTDLTLTPDKKSLEITLYSAVSDEPQSLYAPSLKGEENRDLPAYDILPGGTYVSLEAGERNYFLFTPTEAGLYHISVQDSDAILGYYGISYYVQNKTISEPTGGFIEVNIKQHMLGVGGTNTLVFGLDATGSSSSAVLVIERVGDALLGDEDVPYEVYEPATPPAAFTLPADTKIGEFDLKAATDTYNIVLGSDGYYHMNSENGPLVLVRLGKDAKGTTYLAPLEEIATKSIIGKYFYDEDGKLLKKESYNQCIQDYAKCVDESTGLYPLTEDLKYIIQQRGDHYGWFDINSPGYLFVDNNSNIVPGINNDIAWLVICCYVQE